MGNFGYILIGVVIGFGLAFLIGSVQLNKALIQESKK